MRKINDRIFLGFLAGIIGNISKTVVCQIFHKKGKSNLRCSDLAAGIFLSNRILKRKKGVIFGILCDYVVAGLNGISYVYLLTYTGKDYAIFKGLLHGLFNFGFLRGFITQFNKNNVFPKDICTNVIMSITSSIWGITTAIFTLQLADKALFKPKPRVQSNPVEAVNPKQILFKIKMSVDS